MSPYMKTDRANAVRTAGLGTYEKFFTVFQSKVLKLVCSSTQSFVFLSYSITLS